MAKYGIRETRNQTLIHGDGLNRNQRYRWMKKRLSVFSAGLLLLTGLGAISSPAPDQMLRPRLLLFLTFDQARYEYFVRFRPAFKDGFKYLLDHGISFAQAHQNHAVTVTAPGHASLSTGLYPRHSGIIGNMWYDRETKEPIYSVGDPIYPLIGSTLASSGRSPRNLLGTTIGDWMKWHTPGSKTFSAGGKDRSAILIGGKSAEAALWYDRLSGEFVTSQYYWDNYPPWMEEFHRRKLPDAYFGKAWTPLPVNPRRYLSLGIERLDENRAERNFPHYMGGLSPFPDSSFYSAFFASPFMDAYLVQFAQALIEHEALGADEDVDFLGLSFSAIDSVGHGYGPNSPEILDTFLRLDQYLGEFLNFLDERVGLENVVISMSADHGVVPMPEYRRRHNLPGGRAGAEDFLCFQTSGRKFETKFGEDEWFLEGFYLNYEALGRRNLRRQEVEEELARLLEQCPLVANVWTRTQLESPAANMDSYQELFRNNFHRQRSPDLFVQLKKFYLGFPGFGTSHGSAYEYDTHVPLLIRIPGIPGVTINERVNTVDLAPTLASLLNLPMPEKLDGADRSHWLTAHQESAKQ